jgi:two-component system chemotaxis response regulator CheB
VIRILVASGVPSISERLVRMLEPDSLLSVVGEASSGAQALSMTRRLRPSLILMDSQMLSDDGLQATRQIMTEIPTAIVIASNGPDAELHDVEMSALKAGALTIVHSPGSGDESGFAEASREMISTVKAMAPIKLVRRWPDRPSWHESRPDAAPAAASGRVAAIRPGFIAMAASTGGPGALQEILHRLPSDFPLPILVVQHITGGFTQTLVNWLACACPLRVKIADHGEAIVPGTVYIAPDWCHLGISAPPEKIALSNTAPIGAFRPSANHLFACIAEIAGPACVCVMLTGMGEDGIEGLAAVRRAGGLIIAQDEASSVVFGMPGKAIAAGLADAVLPLSDIGAELIQLAALPRR